MKHRGYRSGAVAVEFAIVASVLLSLLMLAMETGWQLVIESALGAGARAASRIRQHRHHDRRRNNTAAA